MLVIWSCIIRSYGIWYGRHDMISYVVMWYSQTQYWTDIWYAAVIMHRSPSTAHIISPTCNCLKKHTMTKTRFLMARHRTVILPKLILCLFVSDISYHTMYKRKKYTHIPLCVCFCTIYATNAESGGHLYGLWLILAFSSELKPVGFSICTARGVFLQ